ncbi:thioesterase family protein [Haloimpatiens sp. FM7330]|uniref:thioesterase family protein n=1 Tax=Haloimpatiens sp. FM7330 TaxID=3298610 RepID=UPI003645118A
MDFNIKEGLNCLIEKKVTQNDTAVKFESGTLQVFATPGMIALMENTSKNCVDLHLPCGYTTVGIEVRIRHIKATPIGMKVKCEAKLVKVEGKKLYFNVTAWDEIGKIGIGTHVRYIVHEKEFMEKIQD